MVGSNAFKKGTVSQRFFLRCVTQAQVPSDDVVTAPAHAVVAKTLGTRCFIENLADKDPRKSRFFEAIVAAIPQLSLGLKVNLCPPMLASYMSPPLVIVKTAIPLW